MTESGSANKKYQQQQLEKKKKTKKQLEVRQCDQLAYSDDDRAFIAYAEVM